MNSNTFFNGQILVVTKSFETIGDDLRVSSIVNEAVSTLGDTLRPIISIVAGAYVYTIKMDFQWRDDVPEEYKKFSILAQMLNDKTPFLDVFKFVTNELPTGLIFEWREAVNKSLAIWKPVHEGNPDKTTDPN